MPKKICVAPGHGGFDPGACAFGYMEKNFTLGIGLALESKLQAAGIPVIMTRTGDYAAGHATTVQGDLQNECAIANNALADLFVCIHINAATDPSATGAQSFVYRMGGESSTLGTQLADALEPMLGIHGTPCVADPSLYVLRNTKMPAVLIECGFITNQAQAQALHSGLNEVAQLLAEPLIAWAGGSVPQPLPDVNQLPADVQSAIAAVEKLGIMTRDPSGNFQPDATVERWELAVVVERLLAQLKG